MTNLRSKFKRCWVARQLGAYTKDTFVEVLREIEVRSLSRV